MQTREEFLAERKTGIGGSDIASLFGVGYGCRRRLWYDKSGIEPDFERESSDLMELGNMLEPFFRKKYAQKTRRHVAPPGNTGVLRHQEHPELLVHLDGMIEEPRGASSFGALELKSVGRAVFHKVKREGLPEDYILQLQHGILVSGADWGSFGIGSRDSGEMENWDVERDDQICDLILQEGPAFWKTIRVADAIPDRLDPEDGRCQKCEYRLSCQGAALIQIAEAMGETIEADESLRPIRTEYVERKALVEEAEALLDETKEEFKTRMGDRVAVLVAGKPVYFRPQTAMRWDGKTLAAYADRLRAELIQKAPETALDISLYPPVDKFQKQSVSRPFRVY